MILVGSLVAFNSNAAVKIQQWQTSTAVSYTHLDVYKRQTHPLGLHAIAVCKVAVSGIRFR